MVLFYYHVQVCNRVKKSHICLLIKLFLFYFVSLEKKTFAEIVEPFIPVR